MAIVYLPWKPVDFSVIQPATHRVAIHKSPSQASFHEVLEPWKENGEAMDKWKSIRDTRNTVKAKLDEDHNSGGFTSAGPLAQFFSHLNGQPTGEHDHCGMFIPAAPNGRVTVIDIDAMQERATRHRGWGTAYEIAKKNTLTLSQQAQASFAKLKTAAEEYATKHSLPIKDALNIVRKRIAQYNDGKYEERSQDNKRRFDAGVSELTAQLESSTINDRPRRSARSLSPTKDTERSTLHTETTSSTRRRGRSLSDRNRSPLAD